LAVTKIMDQHSTFCPNKSLGKTDEMIYDL